MGGMLEPTFSINPVLGLPTKELSVIWHGVDMLLVQYQDCILDLIYHDYTDFETNKIQNWLRELMRDTILRIAKVVLPARVKYWENMKGLHGSGVTVKRLRKNVLGYCTFNNHITLQPFLVIFKQEWTDGVILHEMAHYKCKHHRKSFWTFLSTLIGEDSMI